MQRTEVEGDVEGGASTVSILDSLPVLALLFVFIGYAVLLIHTSMPLAQMLNVHSYKRYSQCTEYLGCCYFKIHSGAIQNKIVVGQVICKPTIMHSCK